MADSPNTPPSLDQAFNNAFQGAESPDQAYNKEFSQPSPEQSFLPPGPEQRAPAATAPTEEKVNVVAPEGHLVSVASAQLPLALSQGYKPATDEDLARHVKEQKYGGTEQSIIAGIEGAGRGVLGPLAPAIGQSLGASPEAQLAREEVNPTASAVGEIAGLGAGLLTGTGEATLAEKAGVGAAKLVGLGAAESAAAKIGSSAVKAAIENMVISGSDETSHLVMKDPNQSAETAAINIGLSGLIGGTAGGAIGSVNPLWTATKGSKLAQSLKAITERMGGIDGQISDDVSQAIERSGLNIPEEIRPGLSNDPGSREMFKTLEQSDTTKSGQKFQKTLGEFRKQAGDQMVQALGATPESLASMPELSKYEAGKKLGNTLAEEYSSQVSPLSKEFDALRDKYGETSLIPSITERSATASPEIDKMSQDLIKVSKRAAKLTKNGDVQGAIEAAAQAQELQEKIRFTKLSTEGAGTVDRIAHDVADLAQREKWTVSPSSDIMQNVNKILKEIPALKTTNDLGGYISAVGDAMQSDPMNGPLRRAGGMIKSILKKHEADVIEKMVGEADGAEAVERFKAVRKAYAQQADLKEAIDSRLHAKGSTSGYGKALREMAQTDGETLLRRISGTGDADLLNVLQKNFPKTADALRQYHVANVLSDAASKAKPGETINAAALTKALSKMSPELRSFAVPAEGLGKVNAIDTVLSELNKLPHNFSNTARTMDKLFQYIPGSAMGLATILTGHNFVAAAIVGHLTKIISKDVPDAVRLSMLKFLGSSKPINAEGFKAMTDYMNHVIKGDALATKAAKSVFKAGREVLPQAFQPSEKDRKKLDAAVEKIQSNPSSILNARNSSGMHYLPEESAALSQTAMGATNYLNNIRPKPEKLSPLDSPLPPSPDKVSAYNRALDVAVQPLVVMGRIKDGTLLPEDVTHIKSMYPALYNGLVQKITGEMADASNSGEPIPYKTKIGLSLFMGQPMDSSLSPQAILAAQPTPKQPPQSSGGSGQRGSAKALSKASGQYQTEDQAAEARRATKT